MEKVSIIMRVAVHPLQAALWRNRTRIKEHSSLREIGLLIGEDSPQKVKHHLDQMVKLGSIDYIKGQYVFPKGDK